MMNSRQKTAIIVTVGSLTAAIALGLYLYTQNQAYGSTTHHALSFRTKYFLAAALLILTVFLDFWCFFRAKTVAAKIAYFPFTLFYIVLFLILWLSG